MHKPKSVVCENKNNLSIKREQGVGTHLVVDFWNGRIIEDKNKIKEILLKAARKAKSYPLKTILYKFKPQGVTGIVLLRESHISIHTWPEINFVGLDIFTCGKKAKPHDALKYLIKEFKPAKIKIKVIKRARYKNDFRK